MRSQLASLHNSLDEEQEQRSRGAHHATTEGSHERTVFVCTRVSVVNTVYFAFII